MFFASFNRGVGQGGATFRSLILKKKQRIIKDQEHFQKQPWKLVRTNNFFLLTRLLAAATAPSISDMFVKPMKCQQKGLLRLNRGCDAWSGGREHRTVVAMQALLQRNRGIVLLKGSAFQPLLNRKHVCDASRRMEASFRYVSEPRKYPTLTWTKNCIF